MKCVLEGGAKDMFLNRRLRSHCGHLELSERIEDHDQVKKQEHIMLNVSVVQDDVP